MFMLFLSIKAYHHQRSNRLFKFFSYTETGDFGKHAVVGRLTLKVILDTAYEHVNGVEVVRIGLR
jgi:hypothetical protein